MPPAGQLYTIGYEGRLLSEFITLLEQAGVQRLLDVRCNPISRKAGFSKNVLKDALAEHGIEYAHIRQLGIPTKYRTDLADEASRAGLFRFYRESLLPEADSEVWQAAELVSAMPTALMCFELDPLMCHRHVLAEELCRRTGMQAEHL